MRCSPIEHATEPITACVAVLAMDRQGGGRFHSLKAVDCFITSFGSLWPQPGVNSIL